MLANRAHLLKQLRWLRAGVWRREEADAGLAVRVLGAGWRRALQAVSLYLRRDEVLQK